MYTGTSWGTTLSTTPGTSPGTTPETAPGVLLIITSIQKHFIDKSIYFCISKNFRELNCIYKFAADCLQGWNQAKNLAQSPSCCILTMFKNIVFQITDDLNESKIIQFHYHNEPSFHFRR